MLQPRLVRYARNCDRARALGDYRELAVRYDLQTRRIEPIRQAAIDGLGLRPGDRVLDVGCGTGKALPALLARVGPAGQVVGVEQCPEMAELARRRLGPHCPNATLVTAPVEAFRSEQRFDAILLCFTHDVLQNPAAVGRVIEHARDGTRIAVAGLRLLPWWWAAPINLFNVVRARRYLTTRRGLRQPWRPLQPYCADLVLARSWFVGSCYLALGSVRRPGPMGNPADPAWRYSAGRAAARGEAGKGRAE